MSKSYVEKEWVIEHSWKCLFCNYQNKGRDEKCFNCGKDIDEENVDVQPTDLSYSNRVKDEKVVEDLVGNEKPDWYCKFCSHRERDENIKCTECGASKNQKQSQVQQTIESTAFSDTVTTKSNSISIPEPIPPVVQTFQEVVDEEIYNDAIKHDNQVQNKESNLFFLLLICFGILCIGGIVYAIAYSKKTTAVIERTTWNYEVSLHERSIRHGRNWQNLMHSHAFNVSCTREQRGTTRCNPYSCNERTESYSCNCVRNCTPPRELSPSCRNVCTDTGRRSTVCRTVCTRRTQPGICTNTCRTCSRNVHDTCWNRCPVYDNLCSYEYPIWEITTRASSSRDDHFPVRPSINLNGQTTNFPMCLIFDMELLYQQNNSNTRCVTENLSFSVMFRTRENTEHTIHPSSIQEYNRFLTGRTWNVEINLLGGLVPISEKHNN